MNRIAFITPEDARFGFSLAGVQQVVADPAGTAAAIEKTIADADIGLIFMDERLHWGLDEEWLASIDKNWPGLLIVLPAPEKLAELPEDYALQLIVRAIGYQVRL